MKSTSFSPDEVTTFRRAIALAKHASVPEQLIPRLSALPGVMAVNRDKLKPRLWVTYDIRHLNYLQLCQSISDAGGKLATGRWSRWQRDWYNFQDQNLRDNLNHRPACCSKPPPGVAVTGKGGRDAKH